MSGLIAQYLAEFDRELGFDRRLARRVHQEIEAHLQDAMDDAGTDTAAIARFGNPRQLAREYADAALPVRLRRTYAMAGALALATFVFMRLRSMLLDLPGMDSGPNMVLTFIDRAGFGIGLILALYAWYVARAVAGVERARYIFVPLLGAATAFLFSIIASLLRAQMAASGEPLVWITGTLEIFLLCGVAFQLRLLSRHATLAAG